MKFNELTSTVTVFTINMYDTNDNGDKINERRIQTESLGVMLRALATWQFTIPDNHNMEHTTNDGREIFRTRSESGYIESVFTVSVFTPTHTLWNQTKAEPFGTEIQ